MVFCNSLCNFTMSRSKFSMDLCPPTSSSFWSIAVICLLSFRMKLSLPTYCFLSSVASSKYSPASSTRSASFWSAGLSTAAGFELKQLWITFSLRTRSVDSWFLTLRESNSFCNSAFRLYALGSALAYIALVLIKPSMYLSFVCMLLISA